MRAHASLANADAHGSGCGACCVTTEESRIGAASSAPTKGKRIPPTQAAGRVTASEATLGRVGCGGGGADTAEAAEEGAGAADVGGDLRA